MISVSRSDRPQRLATLWHLSVKRRRFSVGSRSTAKARSRSVNAMDEQAVINNVPKTAQGYTSAGPKSVPCTMNRPISMPTSGPTAQPARVMAKVRTQVPR